MGEQKNRPAISGRPAQVVYDWLDDNGVAEWLPEDPVILVAGQRIVYTAFKWSGPRGWDIANVDPDFDTTVRAVPLQVPPPPDVEDILTELKVTAAVCGTWPDAASLLASCGR
jgi:hypothetical protein